MTIVVAKPKLSHSLPLGRLTGEMRANLIGMADDGEHAGDHGSRSFCRVSWKTSCVLVSLLSSS
jgi:hypothetical protein